MKSRNGQVVIFDFIEVSILEASLIYFLAYILFLDWKESITVF